MNNLLTRAATRAAWRSRAGYNMCVLCTWRVSDHSLVVDSEGTVIAGPLVVGVLGVAVVVVVATMEEVF